MEAGRNTEGNPVSGKKVITDKLVEKSANDSGKAVVTAEFNRDVASHSGKKSREVKCFKCQSYGHIAS